MTTKNRIDLLTHAGRTDITNKTKLWWETNGWLVHLWDNTGYLPSVGRNKIIKDYQNSDREILIMADDDITLYPHRYLTADWLKNPIVKANEVYTVNSNHKMHYMAQNSTGWDDGLHHWSVSDLIGQLYVIANKTVPLQDETLPALEDIEWAWQCFAQGIKCHMLHTVFLREQSTDKGSIFCKDRAERKLVYKQAEVQMYAKWQITKKAEFRKKYVK
jgi:hypothetical protein